MRKMFCFDYDNTVYSHVRNKISDETIQALHKLKEKGHLVVMATGRDLLDADSIEHARKLNPDAMVHCNGLKITIGEQLLYEHHFNVNLMKTAMEFADTNDIILGAITPEAVYFTHDERLRGDKRFVYGIGREFRLYKEMYDKKIHALSFLGKEAQMEEIARNCPGVTYYMFAGGSGADVMDIETSKAEGIEKLLEYYQMTWKEVVAFGDSTNDMEMLKRAGMGVAMGNASDEVKAIADFVTLDIEEEGVAEALKKVTV